jgi:hypothetical protein
MPEKSLKGGCGQNCPPHNLCGLSVAGKICGIMLAGLLQKLKADR